MKTLRKIALLLLAVMLTAALAGCNTTEPVGTEITVEVNARDINGEAIVLGNVTFTSENPTVLEALQQMCIARETSLEADTATGIVSKIGEYGSSTYVDEATGKKMAIGWAWSLNGTSNEDIETRSYNTVIKTGDVIDYYQFSYEAEEDIWFEQADKFEDAEGEG